MFIDLCIQNSQCTSLFALYNSHIRELRDQLPSVVYSSTAHGDAMIPDLFNERMENNSAGEKEKKEGKDNI